MYKSVNGLVPSYISDLIPLPIHETTYYPLRDQNNITVPFCRTEIARKSCIPSHYGILLMKNYEIPQLLPALNINWKIYKTILKFHTIIQ